MDQIVTITFKPGISKEIYQCINLADSFIRNVKTALTKDQQKSIKKEKYIL